MNIGTGVGGGGHMSFPHSSYLPRFRTVGVIHQGMEKWSHWLARCLVEQNVGRQLQLTSMTMLFSFSVYVPRD